MLAHEIRGVLSQCTNSIYDKHRENPRDRFPPRRRNRSRGIRPVREEKGGQWRPPKLNSLGKVIERDRPRGGRGDRGGRLRRSFLDLARAVKPTWIVHSSRDRDNLRKLLLSRSDDSSCNAPLFAPSFSRIARRGRRSDRRESARRVCYDGTGISDDGRCFPLRDPPNFIALLNVPSAGSELPSSRSSLSPLENFAHLTDTLGSRRPSDTSILRPLLFSQSLTTPEIMSRGFRSIAQKLVKIEYYGVNFWHVSSIEPLLRFILPSYVPFIGPIKRISSQTRQQHWMITSLELCTFFIIKKNNNLNMKNTKNVTCARIRKILHGFIILFFCWNISLRH